MNEVQHEYLIKTIADGLGYIRDPVAISRVIYKTTACGAWVQFDSQGILVGTIVEGSDAEYSERVEVTDDPEKLLANFHAAIQNCEDFAKEHFGEDEGGREAPFECKYCGAPSWVDPSDQVPPPDYCHEEDHRNE